MLTNVKISCKLIYLIKTYSFYKILKYLQMTRNYKNIFIPLYTYALQIYPTLGNHRDSVLIYGSGVMGSAIDAVLHLQIIRLYYITQSLRHIMK